MKQREFGTKLAIKRQRAAEEKGNKKKNPKIPLKEFVDRATKLEESGEFVEAIMEWQNAISRFPQNASIRVRHALAAIQVNDMPTAEHEFLLAINLKEDPRPWWYGRLANIQVVLGKRPEAISSYKKALRLDPTQVMWRAALSELERSPEASEASSQFYDDVYSTSKDYAADPKDSPYVNLWDRIAKIVSEIGTQSILDVGCGPGQFAAYLLANCDVEYTGFDFSAVAIGHAKSRNMNAIFHCDDVFETLLFQDQFDTIVCMEVLEHIEKDLEALARFPAGRYALCSVPNYPAFGHVRTFADSHEVKSRYGRMFSDPQIEKVAISRTRVIFLIHGYLSG